MLPGTAPAKARFLVVRSADRRRVMQTALRPKGIHAALDLERRVRPDIPVENLAVIADRLDDMNHPVFGEADVLAKGSVQAEKTADIGIVRIQHLVDIVPGNTQLLGIEQPEMNPLHDVEPLFVT